MTHTKDKPWKCQHCNTRYATHTYHITPIILILRFSKKSSLLRHYQNVHELERQELPALEGEVKQEQEETVEQDAGIVVEVRSEELSDANKQFNVEVAYCEDIGNILDVPNDTLFILDTVERGDTAQEAGNTETENSENLEDIEKFLAEEAKDDAGPEASKPQVSPDVKEVRISKDSSYRIPKSPKKQIRTTAQERKTPHIPYQKEASLRVISVGQNIVKNPAPSSLHPPKTVLTSPKKHSFEEALNGVLAGSMRKPEKVRSLTKGIKVIPASPLPLVSSKSRPSSSSCSLSPSKPVVRPPIPPPRPLPTSVSTTGVKEEKATTSVTSSHARKEEDQKPAHSRRREEEPASKRPSGVVEPYRRLADLPPGNNNY